MKKIKFKLKKNPKLLWGSFITICGTLYFSVWLPRTGIGIPCPFYKVTGHYCPGCGMTRAISSLIDKDLSAAVQNNLMLFLAPPALLVYAILKRYNKHKGAERFLYVIIGIALTYAVLRNFSFFSFLAPIEPT